MGDRMYINVIDPPSLYSFSTLFYYNLKCLSLKHVVTHEREIGLHKYDYVIYIDSDWSIGDSFSEERLTGMLDFLEENEFEMNQVLVMNEIIQNSFYTDEIDRLMSFCV
jgi:hypothetical protein